MEPYWKHRVEDFCKKDGGVTVYEHVVLSKIDDAIHISQLNRVSIPSGRHIIYAHKYYMRYQDEIIHKGNPSISRAVYQMVRISDGKVLSQKIDYGGATSFVLYSGPSTFGCNNVPGFNGDLTNSTFSIEK